MVMARSRSMSPESMLTPASATPVWRSSASVKVVLPWSTWAMMAMFLISIANEAIQNAPKGRHVNYRTQKFLNQLTAYRAVEMLLVCLCVGLGFMNSAVPVIGRRVKRVEFHGGGAAIYNIVPRALRDNYYRVVAYGVLDAVEHRLAYPCLDPYKLVEFVHLLAYLLPRRKAHKHELAVAGGVKNFSKIFVLECGLFDINKKSF